MIPSHIFRAYDIRGIAKTTDISKIELTPEFAYILGAAYACFLQKETGADNIRLVVGHDNRETGDALAQSFIEGIRSRGADAFDLGFATSPYLYFTVCAGTFDGGVNITGSHNPPEYNGFKMTRSGAAPIAGKEIQKIRELCEELVKKEHDVKNSDSPDAPPMAGLSKERSTQIIEEQRATFHTQYFAKIHELTPTKRRLKIVIDCGNGTASYFAPTLFRTFDTEVIELYCDPDPSFPNHLPNPEETETLHDLQQKVLETGADLGLAWDGDADRVGIVDERGQIIPPDHLLILLARDLLTRKPGTEIIFDVKCSNILEQEIKRLGGKPTRWKTGHSFIKQKMRETGALLAGEVSGHIFFGENYFGVDDGILAAAKILSIVSQQDQPASTLLADLPPSYNTPELKAPIIDTVKFAVMERIAAEFAKQYTCDTLDGVRFTFADGAWGLIRPSNTSPYLTLRFEAGSAARLAEIRTEIKTRLAKYPEVDLSKV